MPLEPCISSALLHSIAEALSPMLTHPEISRLLPEAKLLDISPDLSKPKRLFNAFADFQNKKQCANQIQVFIQKVVSPHRYVGKNEEFEQNRQAINKCLLFTGVEILPNGNYRRVEKASTLPEAEQRANVLKQKLKQREVHPDVIKFCQAELIVDNYFHAVFEAVKSVADKIRIKSGFTGDGGELVDKVFALGSHKKPKLSFSSLSTESEESEHKGFMNLLKGMFGMFRNTTGHEAKIKWQMSEEDAVDCLTLASFAHRKLDICVIDRF